MMHKSNASILTFSENQNSPTLLNRNRFHQLTIPEQSRSQLDLLNWHRARFHPYWSSNTWKWRAPRTRRLVQEEATAAAARPRRNCRNRARKWNRNGRPTAAQATREWLAAARDDRPVEVYRQGYVKNVKPERKRHSYLHNCVFYRRLRQKTNVNKQVAFISV